MRKIMGETALFTIGDEDDDEEPRGAPCSVTNSSYELFFLKIRAKYEHILNKNTSKIKAFVFKKNVNSTRDIFTTKVRKSALFF